MIYEPDDKSIETPGIDQQAVDEIVSRGPAGALALAGVSTLMVMAIWFAFYFWVFLPRN